MNLISIIIPTLNRAHLISETLDSIIAQTYENWECIVVDDGSTDNTAEVMAKYTKLDSRIQYHHRPEELKPGGNDARNYGFGLGKGLWLQWVDDDDILLPEFLEYNLAQINPKVNLLINPITFWNTDTNTEVVKSINLETTIYTDYLCWRLKVFTPSVLFRKSFLQTKSLFSSDILRGQETEFFLRIFYDLEPQDFIILEKSYFLYRQHELSKSGRNKNYVPEYKDSTFQIYFANYLKLQNTENIEAKRFCYEHLLGIFYHSLNHKDLKLAKRIYHEFFPVLKEENPKKTAELLIVSRFFISIQRGSWRFIKRWKKIEF